MLLNVDTVHAVHVENMNIVQYIFLVWLYVIEININIVEYIFESMALYKRKHCSEIFMSTSLNCKLYNIKRLSLSNTKMLWKLYFKNKDIYKFQTK